MPRTVRERSRGCLGCSLVVVVGLLVVIFFHRYVWQEEQAPDLAELNRRRMAQVNRAYYGFHNDNKRYPESFQELMSPKNYAAGVHQDVWGNEYRILEKGGSVYVYSFGPDMTDDLMEIRYDPTNGARSTGDQALILRRSSSRNP